MKLVSYTLNGALSAGVMISDEEIAHIWLPAGEASPMLRLLRGGPDAVRLAGQFAVTSGARVALQDVELAPVVPDPHAIWCAAGTYRAHLQEGGHLETSEPPWFLRVADSLCGAGAAIVRPVVSDRLDYEGELAVVIGRDARHVTENMASDYIAGFTCFNDASLRDWQRHSTQIGPGKNFHSTGALGPWIVTSDEFGDPHTKRLQTRLNGDIVQDASTEELMFSVGYMISYLSKICTLRAGDIIATGTCAGVGNRRNPQLFMKNGDVVEVEIEGIGILKNPVVDEEAAS